MTTLSCPIICNVLNRLYAQAETNDSAILPNVGDAVAASGQPLDDSQYAAYLDRAFIPVSAEVGKLLYMLVRAKKPLLAVEFGTSFGLSSIFIAAGLRDNGIGRLVTAELNERKISQAAAHLQEAGLNDLVEFRHGDAFDKLRDMQAIDFLLLDGWKKLYLPMLKQLEPQLSPGALIVADDMTLMPEMLKPYLDYVRSQENGYTSCELPMGDGVELTLRN